MMKSMRLKTLLTASSLLLAGSLAYAAPLGELTVRGNAQITSSASQEAVQIRNDSIRWSSGDTLELRGDSSQAVLALDDGSTFGFDVGTQASLARNDQGVLQVELVAGAFLYSIDADQPLVVTSGDYVFRTMGDEARAIQVSNEADVALGLIQITREGQLHVSVSQGVLLASHISGDLHYQVVAGDTIAFEAAEPRMVQVQSGPAAAGAGDGNPVIAAIRDNPGMAVAIAGAAGAGIYFATKSGGGDDDEPASP